MQFSIHHSELFFISSLAVKIVIQFNWVNNHKLIGIVVTAMHRSYGPIKWGTSELKCVSILCLAESVLPVGALKANSSLYVKIKYSRKDFFFAVLLYVKHNFSIQTNVWCLNTELVKDHDMWCSTDRISGSSWLFFLFNRISSLDIPQFALKQLFCESNFILKTLNYKRRNDLTQSL